MHEDRVDIIVEDDALDPLHQLRAIEQVVAGDGLEFGDLPDSENLAGRGALMDAGIGVDMDVHLLEIRGVVRQGQFIDVLPLFGQFGGSTPTAQLHIIVVSANH